MCGNKRYIITVRGIVQGVGFRPFVYSEALSLSLKGRVYNVSQGVVVDIEGEEAAIEELVKAIRSKAPPLAVLKGIDIESADPAGYTGFEIAESSAGFKNGIYISPDTAICRSCRDELCDPSNRRYLYPFINCTDCGPRFTIVTEIPYDRPNTTMSEFDMCSECAEEYKDPCDRRYHAQPVSCYSCGPRLTLADLGNGKEILSDDIMSYTRRLIADGKIIAIKGLGGYHLACDAHNEEAVFKLRSRKIRDEKPFALMARDYGTALRYCCISPEERELLESQRAPIVLLEKKHGTGLTEQIAPGSRHLGIMLPYTPVHLLILNNTGPIGSPSCDLLVMTSGNLSDQPIYYRDREAFENLRGIADYILTNDRQIFVRTDDSVTRVFMGKEYIIRRSRGYAPMPVTFNGVNLLSGGLRVPSVLACGGELKSTFCINRGDEFYLSHHIGDLKNFETLLSFEEGIEHFKKIFSIRCDAVAHDLHPGYLSTKYAVASDFKDTVGVQHHHAHIASCMAENGLAGEVVGVAFDGTGYGEDGSIWGGEFFAGGYKGFKRMGQMEYVKMPGGDMAVKQPWRMALAYLLSSGDDIFEAFLSRPQDLWKGIDTENISALSRMMGRGINSPLTSSMGRLFDAVSALAGVRTHITYEGQAAIELECIMDHSSRGSYGFSVIEGQPFKVCMQAAVREIVRDVLKGVSKGAISAKFHETAAGIVLEGCMNVRRKTGLNDVVLSGGVFQNITLLEKCISRLEKSNFTVYIHSSVPSNDAGLCLGQAAIAIARLTGR